MNRCSIARNIIVTVTIGLLSSAPAGCGPTAYKITPVPVDRTLEETELLRESAFASDTVVLVDVDGILMNQAEQKLFGEGEQPVALLLEKLRKAEKDPQVCGLVLRINSPGGSVTASDLMHLQIQQFKSRTHKPVVTVMMDVAASGGYYIACASDHIIAHPTTVTGSIGVIMQLFSLRGTLEKIGVKAEAIKSGPNKDAGSPFRDLADDQRRIFQGIIDEFYQRFVEVVKAGRSKLSEERIRELADGRVYTGRQALEAGLVDEIGTLNEGIELVRKKSGAGKIRLVTYHRPLDWKPNIYAQTPTSDAAGARTIQIQLPDWLRNPAPQFLYLWAP